MSYGARAGVAVAIAIATAMLVWKTRPSVALHHVVADDERIVLASASGWQTVSMRDGGHTGLYYDAAEDLLKGMVNIRRVALLGLGGGEMLKGAHRAQPKAALVGIEIDEETAQLAKSEFAVPGEVIVADAIEWIKDVPPASLDVLMVDLFSDATMVEASTREPFLGSCARTLHPFGLYVQNVFPADRADAIEAQLDRYFVTAQQHYGPNVVITGMRRP